MICDDLETNNNCTNNNISANNINMSDPNNNDPTPAAPAGPSIFSYFTGANASAEFKTEWPEMVLVFLTSAGISFAMKDSPLKSIERGSVLAVGQYLGGYLADAMTNATYFVNSTNSFVLKYGALMTKFGVATSVFIIGNKAIIGTNLPVAEMFGESALASVVAHYGAKYITPAANSATGGSSSDSALPQY